MLLSLAILAPGVCPTRQWQAKSSSDVEEETLSFAAMTLHNEEEHLPNESKSMMHVSSNGGFVLDFPTNRGVASDGDPA